MPSAPVGSSDASPRTIRDQRLESQRDLRCVERSVWRPSCSRRSFSTRLELVVAATGA
jgi:hypothetical protein